AIRPSWGVCLVLFLTLVADPIIAPWFPVTSGFSARESILFVADWLIISPLECLLLVAFGRWAFDTLRTRRMDVPHSALIGAAVVFGGFLAAGFIHGVAARGNLNIGLWELRGPSYLLAMLAVTVRYIRSKTDMVRLMWSAMLAIAVEAVWITAHLVFAAP